MPPEQRPRKHCIRHGSQAKATSENYIGSIHERSALTVQRTSRLYTSICRCAPSGMAGDAVAEVEDVSLARTCNTARGLTGAICIIERLSKKVHMQRRWPRRTTLSGGVIGVYATIARQMTNGWSTRYCRRRRSREFVKPCHFDT